MVGQVHLPPQLADEVLCQYADVLRVGCVTVNNQHISWDNSASNDAQLQGFCDSFVGALRRLPQLRGVPDDDLIQAAHWFCKSVSINYALAELLALLQQRLGERLGAMCSVRTCGPDGRVLVEYSLRVTEERRMLVRVSWKGTGNIICCNPKTAKRTVSGTLSYVETEFPIALEGAFRPTYGIRMRLKKSKRSQLMSKVVSTLTGRKNAQLEEVSPNAPLRSTSGTFSNSCCRLQGVVAASASLSAASSQGTSTAANSDESDAEEGVDEDVLFPMPLVFEPRTVKMHTSQGGNSHRRESRRHLDALIKL
mmetsp:Transcript_123815/g.358121  ORF Transcript_123815/g.358121 Transcript_123815/m.358121 type:complete len:309 (-) Transcript_123815:89-1015(-)